MQSHFVGAEFPKKSGAKKFFYKCKSQFECRNLKEGQRSFWKILNANLLQETG